jgi:transposase
MIGKKKRSQPTLFIPGSIEDFIPDDHILKRVDRVIDLSWLRGEVAGSYCDNNGRPGIDPEAALRLMLAGFFHGITHDRKLMREAQVNIAIRWFAGYSLDEPLPDHSSLTRIRQRWGADQFRRIFTRTVAACAAAGLVSGETVHVDATLIRADVSWESLTEAWADTTMKENPESTANEDDANKPGRGRPRTKEKQPKKRSTTDPDATLTTSSRDFRMEPCYKQHTSVDDAAGVIVDIEVTTGEASEGERLIETIGRAQDTTGRPIKRITADAAYAHSRNYAACEDLGIDAVIPPQKSNNTKNAMPSSRFKYDGKHQRVRCPAGHDMPHRRRSERGLVFRMNARARRRHTRWDAETAASYKRHRWRVEGVHGEAKTQHGLRRAVRRGMDNVAIQAFLTAAAMNLKRLAAFCSLLKHAFRPCIGVFRAFLSMVCITSIFLKSSIKKDFICAS